MNTTIILLYYSNEPIQIVDIVGHIAFLCELAGKAAHKGPRLGTLYASFSPIVEVPDEKYIDKAKQSQQQ